MSLNNITNKNFDSFILVIGIAFIALVLDIILPLGVAGGITQVLPVLLGLWLLNRRQLMFITLLATSFIITGYFLSPHGGVFWIVMLNRVLAIFAVLACSVAIFNSAFKQQLNDKSYKYGNGINSNEDELTNIFSPILIVITVASLLLILAVMFFTDRETKSSQQWIVHTQEVEKHINKVFSLIQDLEIGQRGYLLTNDETYLEPFNNASKDIDSKLLALKQLTIDNPAQQKRIKALKKLLNKKLPELNATIELRKTNDIDKALEIVKSNIGKHLMDESRVILGDMYKEEERLLIQGRATASGFHYISMFAYGLAMLIIIGVGLIIVRRIQLFIAYRNKAESDLREAETRIRTIVETIVDGLVTIDRQGIVKTFNPAAEQIFGYKAEEVIGYNVKMLMPRSYAKEHDGYLHNYLTTGVEKVIGLGREVVGQRKDGSTFPMELSVSEMQINDERMFTGIVRDITERKKMERMKSEFISTVSHELRTPLTSIRGALALVLGKAAGQLPDKIRNMLEMANRNSERLTLLINDILDLEKIESGLLEFEFNPVDLVALARQAVADNDGYASQHDARLTLDTSLEQASILGDDHRLLQVFANLISNAVKYSPENGVVKVSVIAHESGYRVSVRDYGLGIPEEFHSRIFQRFAQADSSDTRDKGGTGLGLSITKAIVERHNGQIDYETEFGKGTVFYFDLPVAQTTIRESSKATSAAQVLICEDNPDVAEILAEMLEMENLASDVAATAEGARSLLAKNTYALMLLDLNLPDIDGLVFLKELRAIPASMELPIIVISERATEGCAEFTGDAVMVVDWIQKPIDQKQLERAMKEALRRKARPRILHAEDDLDIIQVTQVLLDDIADVTYEATVKDSRERLSKEEFDLVILDLCLADGSGLELLDELKGRCPIIIFSAQNPDREISAQVTAALTKSMTSNEQLLATIKNVLQGNKK